MEKFDVVIIGAGAAGMMCAIEAGRRGRRVLLLDHAKSAGEKIRISGGGRCNFTNLNITPERFLSQNPRFALSPLSRYNQHDFIEKISSHRIAYHEKTLGQLFCDGSAKEIVAMLLYDLDEARVDLRLGARVDSVSFDGSYQLNVTGESISTTALVVATGGKSIPKMGATGLGYHLAAQFGVPVVPTRPGLVPLTFAPRDLDRMKPLAGISLPAEVRLGKTAFQEGMLFTHRGLSGPSILQISSYWREGEALEIDLSPTHPVLQALRRAKANQGKAAIATAVSGFLPRRLAEAIVAELGLRGNLADQSDKSLANLSDRLHKWQVRPTGSEGYRTAEVTLGGVDTRALNAKTMEVKAHPGLHFIGEVVDVTGWLGGYNFQWAWSSGWVAGQAVCP